MQKMKANKQMTEREQKQENDAEAYCIKADFKFF